MLWLCPKCALLGGKPIEEVVNVPHHLSFTALKIAAMDGCHLCQLFLTATSFAYIGTYGKSLLEAEIYHTKVDEEDETKAESERRPFCVSAMTPSREYADKISSNGLFGLLYTRPFPRGWSVDLTPVKPFLSAYPADAAPASRIVGRMLPPMPDLGIAMEWLLECKEFHPHCKENTEDWLPSRIIDIGFTNSELRLRESDTMRGQYVTLTHRWGKTQPYKTVSANYLDHLNSINFDALPRTFQDAIEVTRSMGLQYLWIDALCIIQDSKEDWAKECVEMPRIYGLSSFTIAGSHAAEPSSGFFHSRSLNTSLPLGVEWPSKRSDKKLRFNLVFQNTDITFQPLWNSVTAKRAWILQERLLSQRILYFTQSMMYWECNCTHHFEAVSQWISEKPVRPELSKMSLDQLPDRKSLLQRWYEATKTYSSCALTRATDKFPALSGIAQVFNQRLGDEYIAGLWREDLARGLSWHVPFYEKAGLAPHPELGYIAPSWSWASVYQMVQTDELEHPDPEFQVNNTMFTLSTIDPFGQIRDARLTVSGRFHKAVLVGSKNKLILQGKPQIQADDQSDCIGGYWGQYYPDNGERVDMKMKGEISRNEAPEDFSFSALPERDKNKLRFKDIFDLNAGWGQRIGSNELINNMMRDDEHQATSYQVQEPDSQNNQSFEGTVQNANQGVGGNVQGNSQGVQETVQGNRENVRSNEDSIQSNEGVARGSEEAVEGNGGQHTDSAIRSKEVILLCLGVNNGHIQDWNWKALVLELVREQENTYRRIGIAESSFDLDTPAEQWYRYSDFKATIDII